MTRRVETVTIAAQGRDSGKRFILTEMPAIEGEKWATQALFLLVTAGIQVPETAQGAGMAGLAQVDFNTESPLAAIALTRALQDETLDAWWSCVAYEHDPAQKPQKIIQGAGCQIEEIATINELRVAVLNLHTHFFSPEKPSTSVSRSRARAQQPGSSAT